MKPLLISFLAIMLLGCSRNTNNFKLADSASSNPAVDTVTHHLPGNLVNEAPTNSSKSPSLDTTVKVADTTTNTGANLPSILSSSTIKFDENFNPVATITLHNTTGKEIDQILFRFTFTNHRLSDGPIDLVAASDYSTYVNLTVNLKPPDYQTVQIQIPEPRMKAFDTPNIFITKVRYYNGTIDTDDR